MEKDLMSEEAPPEAERYTVVEEVADKFEESSIAPSSQTHPNSTTSKASKKQASSSYRQSIQIKSGHKKTTKGKKTSELSKEDAMEKNYQN